MYSYSVFILLALEIEEAFDSLTANTPTSLVNRMFY
jgi:hypothetical protein